MTSPPYVALGFALKFNLCKCDKNEHTKRVNHPRDCPNYILCKMYTSVKITTMNEQNTVYWNEN